MTAESNKTLLEEYNLTKCLKVKDKILRQNGGLVKEIIQRKFDYPNQFDDLYQEGLIGLNYAIDKYDVARNINFSTFAYKVVKNKIINYLRKQKPIIFEELTDLYQSSPQAISVDSFIEMSNIAYKDIRNRFWEGIMSKDKLNNCERRAFKQMKTKIKRELQLVSDNML